MVTQNAFASLDVKVINAQLTRDTELFGKMSPFVQIEIGCQMKRSGTCNKGGKTPDFGNEILRFKVTTEKTMKVIVYDEEKMKAKHDHVGDGTINLDRILAGHVKKQTLQIMHKGKSAGSINLEFEVMNQMAANVGSKLVAGMNLQGIVKTPVPPPMGANAPV